MKIFTFDHILVYNNSGNVSKTINPDQTQSKHIILCNQDNRDNLVSQGNQPANQESLDNRLDNLASLVSQDSPDNRLANLENPDNQVSQKN